MTSSCLTPRSPANTFRKKKVCTSSGRFAQIFVFRSSLLFMEKGRRRGILGAGFRLRTLLLARGPLLPFRLRREVLELFLRHSRLGLFARALACEFGSHEPLLLVGFGRHFVSSWK